MPGWWMRCVAKLGEAEELTSQQLSLNVLDNASIHHSIDHNTLERWFLEHKALLFYLPP